MRHGCFANPSGSNRIFRSALTSKSVFAVRASPDISEPGQKMNSALLLWLGNGVLSFMASPAQGHRSPVRITLMSYPSPTCPRYIIRCGQNISAAVTPKTPPWPRKPAPTPGSGPAADCCTRPCFPTPASEATGGTGSSPTGLLRRDQTQTDDARGIRADPGRPFRQDRVYRGTSARERGLCWARPQRRPSECRVRDGCSADRISPFTGHRARPSRVSINRLADRSFANVGCAITR